MSLSRHLAALAVLGVLAMQAGDAAAHAIIIESTPAVGAVVTGSDVPVTVRFNSRIDQERSRLTLTGAGGKAWPLAMLAASSPDTLRAVAHDLPPGAYTLHWQVLAVDGHITRGDIPFRHTP